MLDAIMYSPGFSKYGSGVSWVVSPVIIEIVPILSSYDTGLKHD